MFPMEMSMKTSPVFWCALLEELLCERVIDAFSPVPAGQWAAGEAWAPAVAPKLGDLGEPHSHL